MKNNNIRGVITVLAISLALGLAGPVMAFAAGPAPVNLGSAGNFAILAETGISTTGSTSIGGSIGISPAAASSITGFGLIMDPSNTFSTSAYMNGNIYAADYATPTPATMVAAISDMETAYTTAAGLPNPTETEMGGGNIGGMTLVPGLYKWSTDVSIPTDITLTGAPNDVWIFQIAGNLSVSSAVHVILSGGAQANNIFWIVGGQTTIGTTAVFNGNILDQTAVVLHTGATLNGRALAQTAVTMDSNVVTTPPVWVITGQSIEPPFAVLASTYTNTAATTIDGDLGYITGSGVAPTVNGTTYVNTGIYSQAGLDQATALGILNAETCNYNFSTSTDLSLLQQPLLPGVYCIPGAASIGTGGVTLSGNGTYVFRVNGALTTVANSMVSLTNGASACNVFWTPIAATTLGANTIFAGTDIDASGITVGSTVSWTGQALAFGGTVTTNADTITVPTSCVTPANPATLHIIKLVIGGTAVPSNFTVHVENAGVDVIGSPAPGAAAPGTTYSLTAGTYVVSENPNASYVQSFTGACNASGNVTLSAGQDAICTIVNTAVTVPVVPSIGVSINAGGRIVPLGGIVKVPAPLALPAGPGSVIYNYTVWNVGGQQPLDDITVTDDACSPVTYVSGDTNGNGKLDPGEQWKYTCTMTLSTTTTNTAIATGYSDDAFHQASIATAVATVVVGAPVTPPLINIVKLPSRLTPFPYGGGNVTYMYTVMNPGMVSLQSIMVTDNKCAPVSYISGDVNGNNLLDPGETWTYICKTDVPVTTMDTAMVVGSANGLTATGYAFATVLVAKPGVPNTGFPPYPGNGIPWGVITLAGILVLASALLIVALKKRIEHLRNP